MKKIERLELWEKDIYTLTKKDALQQLAQHSITNSEQVFLRWCRDGTIDAVRVVGAAIKERGVMVNPFSLQAFIASKSGVQSVEKLYIKIVQLEQEKRELEARVAYLESKKRKRSIAKEQTR